MDKVKFYGCYEFDDDLTLIEMAVDDYSDKIDFSQFVVPDVELDEDDWQSAYMEQYLNEEGTEKICELYDNPKPALKPCRFAFFIHCYDTQDKILKTPYGDFSIDKPSALPDRLSSCIEYEEED